MRVGDAGLAAELVGGIGAGTTREAYGRTEVVVAPADWVRAATALRDGLGAEVFDHLGVHDPGRPDAHGAGWEVHLHVLAPARAATAWLVTTLAPGQPLPSLTAVWAGAAWHEREAAEMAGLEVTGHPDLRPLLLADGLGVHPLRKDALLVARAVRPWPGRLEPGEDGVAPTSGRRRATAPGLPPAGWEQP